MVLNRVYFLGGELDETNIVKNLKRESVVMARVCFMVCCG